VNTSKLRRSLLAPVIAVLVSAPLQAADKDRTEEVAKLIQQQLSQKWQENNLQPADKIDDLGFLRRVTLDIIGRIPTLDEVEAFEKDQAPDKRVRWVDRLLAGKEYPENWALLWTRWIFAGTKIHPAYRGQFQGWLKEQFARNVGHKDLAMKLLTATGKSNENPAVHFLLANLGEEFSAEKRAKDGQFSMQPATFRSFSLFLGYQIACIQCHCHPFNADWKLEHFWQLNGYFRQVERKGAPSDANAPMDAAPVLELADNPDFNKSGVIFYERRSGVWSATQPTFLEPRYKLPKDFAGNRREEFVRRVTAHDNFSKALVNRLWGHFFAHSMNIRPGSVDDFGEHNEVVHPGLLDQLAKAFSAAGYDYKQLIRWICASDAYQLRATANVTNEPEEAEVYFSRMLVRPMSFEQMFDSVWTAARLGDVVGNGKKSALREKWRKFLGVQFTDEGTFPSPEVDPWRRMFLLMNNPDVHDALNDKVNGMLALARQRATPEKIADALYLATLTRHPTSAEKNRIEQEIRKERRRSKNGDLAPLWNDLLWALLNSNEFIVHH
jgi:hypothetical protein